jgi:nucleotide-binding universal stress UspA family protein
MTATSRADAAGRPLSPLTGEAPPPAREILVGVGPRWATSAAFRHALALAERDRARLTLVSVAGEPPPTIWLAPLYEDPRAALLNDAVARLRAACAVVPADVSVRMVLRRGTAASGLRDEVKRGRYDLIILGGRERRRPTRALARRVARDSAAPVLVVERSGTAAVHPRSAARERPRLLLRARRGPLVGASLSPRATDRAAERA